MPMVLATVFTAGSMTHMGAPMLMTVEDARLRTPANMEVIATMRKTAKVRPMRRPLNLARSLTRSLNAILKRPSMGSRECEGRGGRLRSGVSAGARSARALAGRELLEHAGLEDGKSDAAGLDDAFFAEAAE